MICSIAPFNKIITVVPFHERVEVSKIFWQNIVDIGLKVIAVVSDKENVTLANKYAYKTLFYNNNPLGAKWDAGIQALKGLNYNYVLILGSDDLISKYMFMMYKPYIDSGCNYIGLNDAVAMSITNGMFRYWTGYTGIRIGESIGSGRLISRRIIEQCNYNIFPNKHKGMDRFMHERINKITGFNNDMINTGLHPYRVGIKTNNSYSSYIHNTPFKYELSLNNYYTDKTIKMLKDGIFKTNRL